MTRIMHALGLRRIGTPGLFVLIAAIFLTGCTTSITESYSGGGTGDESFEINAKTARVVLMPIDIKLTELMAAGLQEPKAEWTENARKHVTGAIGDTLAENGLKLRPYRLPKGSKRQRRDDQLAKLHGRVGGTILVHHYGQAKLATKKGRMDWTLGITARKLGKDQNAEFALFVFLRDSYATAGRKTAMVFSRIIGGGVQAGERVGFASLVDLRTGNVVWFNALYSDTGDLREAEPARKVVDDLMSGFPT